MANLTVVSLVVAVLVAQISGQCTVERARPSFTRSVYEFSSELTSRVARDSEYHFALSPLSIWTIISAISEGAEDTTLDEIRRVLKQHPNRCFNSKYYDIVRSIVGDDEATLERSGLIVFDSSLPVNETFVSKVERIGLSHVLRTPFANFEETANIINSFVNDATHGAIDDVISPEALEGKYLIMVDNIFFKGQWRVPFSTADTEVSSFYSDAGEQLGDVNLMFLTDDFHIVSIEKLQAKVLELPYRGTRFSMLLFLPFSSVPLSQVIETLRDVSLQAIFSLQRQSKPRTTMVQIPRFKIESSLDSLSELLNDMGLSEMFQTSASFPHISSYSLYVSDFTQKASVEVNEEGTVAAATSEAGFSSRMLPAEFNANRPFMFMIVDKESQVVLFTGAYSKPSLY